MQRVEVVATAIAIVVAIGCGPEDPSVGTCVEVVPDEEIRCPYHPVDTGRHNVTYLDLQSGAVMGADVGQPDTSGDVILDPFVGSGTTGIVCQRLNVNCVGIEISKPTIQKTAEILGTDYE